MAEQPIIRTIDTGTGGTWTERLQRRLFGISPGDRERAIESVKNDPRHKLLSTWRSVNDRRESEKSESQKAQRISRARAQSLYDMEETLSNSVADKPKVTKASPRTDPGSEMSQGPAATTTIIKSYGFCERSWLKPLGFLKLCPERFPFNEVSAPVNTFVVKKPAVTRLNTDGTPSVKTITPTIWTTIAKPIQSTTTSAFTEWITVSKPIRRTKTAKPTVWNTVSSPTTFTTTLQDIKTSIKTKTTDVTTTKTKYFTTVTEETRGTETVFLPLTTTVTLPKVATAISVDTVTLYSTHLETSYVTEVATSTAWAATVTVNQTLLVTPTATALSSRLSTHDALTFATSWLGKLPATNMTFWPAEEFWECARTSSRGGGDLHCFAIGAPYLLTILSALVLVSLTMRLSKKTASWIANSVTNEDDDDSDSTDDENLSAEDGHSSDGSAHSPLTDNDEKYETDMPEHVGNVQPWRSSLHDRCSMYAPSQQNPGKLGLASDFDTMSLNALSPTSSGASADDFETGDWSPRRTRDFSEIADDVLHNNFSDDVRKLFAHSDYKRVGQKGGHESRLGRNRLGSGSIFVESSISQDSNLGESSQHVQGPLVNDPHTYEEVPNDELHTSSNDLPLSPRTLTSPPNRKRLIIDSGRFIGSKKDSFVEADQAEDIAAGAEADNRSQTLSHLNEDAEAVTQASELLEAAEEEPEMDDKDTEATRDLTPVVDRQSPILRSSEHSDRARVSPISTPGLSLNSTTPQFPDEGNVSTDVQATSAVNKHQKDLEPPLSSTSSHSHSDDFSDTPGEMPMPEQSENLTSANRMLAFASVPPLSPVDTFYAQNPPNVPAEAQIGLKVELLSPKTKPYGQQEILMNTPVSSPSPVSQSQQQKVEEGSSEALRSNDSMASVSSLRVENFVTHVSSASDQTYSTVENDLTSITQTDNDNTKTDDGDSFLEKPLSSLETEAVVSDVHAVPEYQDNGASFQIPEKLVSVDKEDVDTGKPLSTEEPYNVGPTDTSPATQIQEGLTSIDSPQIQFGTAVPFQSSQSGQGAEKAFNDSQDDNQSFSTLSSLDLPQHSSTEPKTRRTTPRKQPFISKRIRPKF